MDVDTFMKRVDKTMEKVVKIEKRKTRKNWESELKGGEGQGGGGGDLNLTLKAKDSTAASKHTRAVTSAKKERMDSAFRESQTQRKMSAEMLKSDINANKMLLAEQAEEVKYCLKRERESIFIYDDIFILSHVIHTHIHTHVLTHSLFLSHS